jgi:hypothetical protein
MLLLTPMLALCLSQAARPDVGQGPEPAPTPISWELEFRHDNPPKRIDVQGPGGLVTYWYLPYTAINRSAATQRFFPTFQLVTADLKVVDTDTGISALVFEAIAERHRITHKYLTHPTQAIGDLRAGEDNARQSVAIWRDVDLTGARFQIFVGGLSGEARLVANPAYDPQKPERIPAPDGRGDLLVNPKFFTLRKTLELTYVLPGSEATRDQASPVLERVRWVMR